MLASFNSSPIWSFLLTYLLTYVLTFVSPTYFFFNYLSTFLSVNQSINQSTLLFFLSFFLKTLFSPVQTACLKQLRFYYFLYDLRYRCLDMKFSESHPIPFDRYTVHAPLGMRFRIPLPLNLLHGQLAYLNVCTYTSSLCWSTSDACTNRCLHVWYPLNLKTFQVGNIED